MAIDPELAAEMQRRGLSPAPAPHGGPDPELLAEMQRRGIQPPPSPSAASRLLSMAKSVGDSTANAAPTAGMMVGGSIGGMTGAAAGGVGAVPGAIAGAGVGGAAGSAYKRVYQYLTGTRDPNQDTALGNAGDIAKAGLGGMAAETVGQGVGAGASALADTAFGKAVGNLAAKGGAKVMKVAAAIPERYGEAVLKKPSILNDALLPSQRGAPYNAFEGYTGLKGLGKVIEESGRSTMPVGELDSLAVGTANDVRAGLPVPEQQLYSASQAENHMMQAARNQEPGAARALESGILGRAGDTTDAALEKIYPEYAGLRRGNFESQAREAFSNVFPTNKNGTPNVLRPWAAAGEVVRGGISKTPLLPAVSPAAWGMGIRTAAASTPLARFLAKYGAAKTAQDAAEGQ